MNISSGYLKKMGYLVFVFIIIAFFGCGGGSSTGGNEDVAANDIIIRDIQNPADSAVQDIQYDIESRDIEDIKDIIDSGYTGEDIEADSEVGSDITDTSEDISDIQGSDTIEDISTDISDVVEDVVVDGGCKDECTVSICKDNYILNSCGDWNNDGCKEYKEVVCEKGCENGACKTCIANCANKECGDDGCGGSCGVCGDNSTCSNNKCVCNSRYANCNNDLSDGCEVNLNSINSCGTSCSNKVVCSTNNGTNPICDNGVCKLTCNSGYADCNFGAGSSDGCEVNLNNPLTCGTGCGNIVNCGANTVCNSGSCGCISGYYNCNGSLSDGCEKQGDIRHIWSKRFRGSSDDVGYSVSVDSSGNVYITGYFQSSNIDFGGGELTNAGGCEGWPCSDIFLARFDSNGNHKWSKRFGGSDHDYGYSVSVDSSGNVYITGSFSSSTIDFGGGALNGPGIFLAKFDSNGNHLWSKRFGGSSDDIGYSVSVDSSGNVYITGWFKSSTIDFGGGALTNAGGGYPDIFLAKFDSNGNHKWSKKFGGDRDDGVYSVSVDSSGNVYITGSFSSSSINFGGGALTNAGGTDIFLAKFDSNGNHLWSKRFGGSDWDYGNSVSVDSSGNVYITGYFGYFKSSTIDFGGGALTSAGGYDIFLARFDSNGNHKWSKRFGGSSDDRGYSVSVDSSGNVYITGYFMSSTIDFGGGVLTNDCDQYGCPADIFLARFDSNGNHLWSKRFGWISFDYGTSVSVDNSGNVYGTGYFSGDFDFGACPLSGYGDYDIYLIKYAP